jgi:hypothetical protein
MRFLEMEDRLPGALIEIHLGTPQLAFLDGYEFLAIGKVDR